MDLIISNLHKKYANGIKALDGVNLRIEKGLFGLLGPNGAGKSTLMRIIATLQEADEGAIHFGSIDVSRQKNEVRKLLGYLPQDFGVYPKISAELLLEHLAVLKGVSNRIERKEIVETLLQKTNLWDVRKKSLSSYSGGMKQRFGIAQALLSNPKLIIVDEPTSGLDPVERNRFLNLLSELGENAVVILSTHIVEDVKELCNDMAIMNKGHVIYNGSPEKVIESLAGKIWKKKVERSELVEYKQKYNIISERMIGGYPIIYALSDIEPKGFIQVEASLEDVYFSKLMESNCN